MDRARWPEVKARFTQVFASRPRDEWAKNFSGTDACVTPVLAFGEVLEDPQVAARGTVVRHGGIAQAAPAPRFSRTPAVMPDFQDEMHDADEILAEWGHRHD
jgi:alpha-methylacyl-CoA racemase